MRFRETLSTAIELDPSSGLPLLDRQDDVLKLILTYLPLPYSVAEYGCGKKTSLVLSQLLRAGIPAYSLARGLILERDMSPEALATMPSPEREHALRAANPLIELGDLRDPALRRMLAAEGAEVDDSSSLIRVGEYTLEHRRTVQFAVARSHVFPIVTFWDESERRAVDRIVDPTMERDRLLDVARMRALLEGEEAWVFTTPLLGRFRLDPLYLTSAQRREIRSLLGKRSLRSLGYESHAALVRQLCGAAPGTVGDPLTWTYANNIHWDDEGHDASQRRATGRGERLRAPIAALIRARSGRARELPTLRRKLEATLLRLDAVRIVRRDARRAEEALEPLAVVAITVSCFGALGELAARIRTGEALAALLEDDEALDRLHGVGTRLRHRIDLLAAASNDEDDAIDARALGPGFIAAAVETARQMHRAGLTVAVDKVGNLHGLLLDRAEQEDLAAGRLTFAGACGRAIVHASHIDTVKNAGKYDGRLGVLSGIEIAHVLRDLEEHFGLPPRAAGGETTLLVTAFLGEEMSFTGNGVSMPGSATVAGLATVAAVHGMTNARGERLGERLGELLAALREAVVAGELTLWNDLSGPDPTAWIEAAAEPTDFFTPHSYERHIEQGEQLDRDGVPLVLVDTIMGIHQEDVVLSGPLAEAAALELDLRLRALACEAAARTVRITVGVCEPLERGPCFEDLALALRIYLAGQMNHAGATELPNRRDPGVAAARVARRFRAWLDGHPEAGSRLEPQVGDVVLAPGTNRNVIPGEAGVSLGVGGDLGRRARAALRRDLQIFATGTLARPVAEGGEGIRACTVQDVSFVCTATRVRVSIDVRCGDPGEIAAVRAGISGAVAALGRELGVEAASTVEQEVPPLRLAESGQVLQLERSYGGSHNPDEAELAVDVLRGTLLQLAVSRDVLARHSLDGLDLYRTVGEKIPGAWRAARTGFVSGALHDTCNVAARSVAARSVAARSVAARSVAARRRGP